MVRFGKIISIDRKQNFAMIQDKTGLKYIVLSSQLKQTGFVQLNDLVVFRVDTDFNAPVACDVVVDRHAGD